MNTFDYDMTMLTYVFNNFKFIGESFAIKARIFKELDFWFNIQLHCIGIFISRYKSGQKIGRGVQFDV